MKFENTKDNEKQLGVLTIRIIYERSRPVAF